MNKLIIFIFILLIFLGCQNKEMNKRFKDNTISIIMTDENRYRVEYCSGNTYTILPIENNKYITNRK